MKPAWSIVEFKGHSGLRDLEADWKRLVAEMPDRAPQHAYETHLAYFNHLSLAEGRFTCFALTDGDRVRAICPLEIATDQILGRRTHLWGLSWHLYDLRRDVICPPGEARLELLPCLVRFLRRARNGPAWLVFAGVLEGSALWECLRSLDPRAYCSRVVGAADVFACGKSFEELASRWSKKLRGNLRRAHNKLAAFADVRFENATEPPSLGREFEAFLEVEASGWKGKGGARGAIRLKPDQLAFYRELTASLRHLARCEVNAVYAEGTCIASQVCLRSGAEYAIPKIAYDEGYARVAPGQLLLERTLERCCEDPEIRRLTLVSHGEWGEDWGPEAIPVHSVYVGVGRWSGRLPVGLLRLRFAYGPRVRGWLLRSRIGSRIVRWLPQEEGEPLSRAAASARRARPSPRDATPPS